MNNDIIYTDGKYIASNPSLHAEDSEYKMFYIAKLLEKVEWNCPWIKILDIGGGAGLLGKFVCEWFLNHGYTISAYALDLSGEMLEIQKNNNPHIEKTYIGDIELLGGEVFDLVLMIDVIEHIEKCDQFAYNLNKIAKFIVYNIPTEINMFDSLRNVVMRKRYYSIQTESLGHIHFFSVKTAVAFAKRHHDVKFAIFAEYALYVLFSPYREYLVQRKRLIRRIELIVSVIFQKIFPFFAPYCVQGSLFILVQSKK